MAGCLAYCEAVWFEFWGIVAHNASQKILSDCIKQLAADGSWILWKFMQDSRQTSMGTRDNERDMEA